MRWHRGTKGLTEAEATKTERSAVRFIADVEIAKNVVVTNLFLSH